MKVTLMDVRQPRTLLNLLDTCEGSVSCCGVELRNDRKVGDLICSLTASGQGLPQLELTLGDPRDLSRFLRYVRENGGMKLSIDYNRAAA